MNATIRDVAKRAEVAPSTVSAVINKKGYVNTATRARILAAIDELAYTPNRTARGLANRTSGNIGFIVSDTHFSRVEPFYTRVFLGTEFEARHHDLYVLLTSVDVNGPAARRNLPRFLLERNVDGVIIAGRVPAKLIQEVRSRDIPVITVDFTSPSCECSRVLIDNRGGMEALTRHLLDLGHQRIGFIGAESDHPSIAERLEGYRTALQKAGLAPDDALVAIEGSVPDSDTGAKVFRSYWEGGARPTAVVCANDAVAFGVLAVARQLGVKVPEQLSVAGFDNVPSAAMLYPTLTTVHVDKEDLGAKAVEVLVRHIRRGDAAHELRVPTSVIERGSTAAPVGIAVSDAES